MSMTFENDFPRHVEDSGGPRATEEVHFGHLFDDVEDLIKRVADVDSPEVKRLRAKARMALIEAKSAWQNGAAQTSLMQGYQASGDHPWHAFLAATLLGLGVGLIVRRC